METVPDRVTGLRASHAMHQAGPGTPHEETAGARQRFQRPAADGGFGLNEYINEVEALAGHDRSPGLACLQCGAVCVRDDMRLGILG